MRIAVSGGIGAGKTQLVERLVRDHGFQAVSFSQEIRDEMALALRIGADWIELNKGDNPTLRRLMQEWGQFRVEMNLDYWISKLINRVHSLDKHAATVSLVADSVRKPREVAALRALGFLHVRLHVSRDRQMDYLQRVKGFTTEKAIETLEHSSERALDEFDDRADINIRVPSIGDADLFVFVTLAKRLGLALDVESAEELT